jgi:flagellar biosynthesis protein FlhA
MDTANSWIKRIFSRSDVFVAVGVILIVMIFIVPLNTMILDILIAFNISFGLLILLLTLFNGDPLEFSVFPSILLVMTLFRVALNVASTKLILLEGFAGDVIETFGSFVVGGNTIVGLVVFLILVVIQFIVITKGAERVSEVGARFTLDAMPGKQMAIDADLNAGMIDETEARQRRQKIQDEADFYGAMDGASKFVKGDAVAGIVIVMINIIGGLIIGMVQRDLSLGEAGQIYTILTVGDGLVSQIPALLISTATGIVVTSSGSSTDNLGTAVARQFFTKPVIFLITAIFLFLLGSIGLPRLPMYLIAACLGTIYFVVRPKAEPEVEAPPEEDVVEAAEFRQSENLIELLQVEKMEMEMGYGLIPLVDPDQGGDLLDRIIMIRRQCAVELGFIVPPIRIRDNMQLKTNAYAFKLKGMEIASGELMLQNLLAIGPNIDKDFDMTGIDTLEPAFQLPAKWITHDDKDLAEIKGYTVVDPPSVLVTHLTTVIRAHAYELLGRQEIQNVINFIREGNAAVIEELIPDLMTIGDIQKVLANLLKEQVSIRDMASILETLADYAKNSRDPDVLTEYVRQSLKRQISKQYAGKDKKISVVTLEPSLEELMRQSLHQTDVGSYLALEPDTAQAVIDKLTAQYQILADRGVTPVVLCPPIVRIYFKRLTERFIPHLVVLSYNEVDSDFEVEVGGMVTK